MLFNTQAFALFFAVVFVAYWLLRRHEMARVILLLVSSYVFYGNWSWNYCLLILFSTVLDYSIGMAMGRATDDRHRKRLLMLSLFGNLGVLGAFKYYDFFVGEMAALLGVLGFEANVDSLYLRVILPVGISFYTFQTLSYTIDLYRRQIEPERNFLRFALFVSFFPQLVAGPIVRARNFLPQISKTPELTSDGFNRGLSQIFWGLFKKVLIADYLGGTLVDPFWGSPDAYGGWDSMLGIYGYAFQVYGDFSGYSDIAIGTARLLGYDLGENFHSPYRTCSLKEHWMRWHISLSTWLRDYLYIPLGGNRAGFWGTNRNLMITMFLGGLWHGVGTTFLVWGVYQGALLVGERLVGLKFEAANAFTRWGRRLYAFHATCAGYILFRSPTFGDAQAVAGSLFGGQGTASYPVMPLFVLVLAVVVHLPTWGVKTAIKDRFVALPGLVQGGVYAVLTGLMMNVADMKAPFIYFQFLRRSPMLPLGRQQLGIAVGYALVTVVAHFVSQHLHLDVIEPFYNPVRAGVVSGYSGRSEIEDVLVLGTSRVDVGLDGRLMQDALDGRFNGDVSLYKLGVPGLGLEYMAQLVAGPIARPPKRLLMVDVDPRSFLAKGAQNHERRVLLKPFGPDRSGDRIVWHVKLHTAVESVFLGLKKTCNLWWLGSSRVRDELAFQRENSGERFTIQEAVTRDERLMDQYVRDGREKVLELPEGRAWIWMRNSDADVVGFANLLDALEALPCDVVFVRPPLEMGYPERWMPQAQNKYKAQVVPMIEERFPYFDLNRRPYPRAEAFYMAKHHLNRRGCEIVSRLMVDDLIAPLLLGEPVPANP